MINLEAGSITDDVTEEEVETEVGEEVREESDEPKTLAVTIKERLQRIWHKELKTLPTYDPEIHEPPCGVRGT